MENEDGNADSQELKVENVQPESEDEEWVKFDWANKKNEGEQNETSTRGVEEASEALEDLEQLQGDTVPMEQQSENANCYSNEDSEESDGVSIITESEIESNALNKKLTEFCRFQGNICGPMRMIEISPQNSPQAGSAMNILLACVIGVLLGLLISNVLTFSKRCPESTTINFESIKDTLLNNMKELNEMKTVLDEMKMTAPKLNQVAMKALTGTLKRIYGVKFNETIDDDYFDANSTLEHLQFSLNALSAVVSDIFNVDATWRTNVNKTQIIMTELSALQQIVAKFGNISSYNDSPEIRFLENANEKINRTSLEVLSNFASGINKLTANVYQKFNKMRYKLSKKLCYLRNTSDHEFLKGLENSTSFLKDCNDTLLARKKSDEKYGGNNIKRKNFKDKKNNPTLSSTQFLRSTHEKQFSEKKIDNADAVLKFQETNAKMKDVDKNIQSEYKTSKKQKEHPKLQSSEFCAKSDFGEEKNADCTSEPHENQYDAKFNEPQKAASKVSSSKKDEKKARKKEFNGDLPKYKKEKHKRKGDFQEWSPRTENKYQENESDQDDNAEWLFRRSDHREKQRDKSDYRQFTDSSNWYLKRAYSRENSRESYVL